LKALELEAWSRRVCELSHAEAAEVRATGLVDVVAEAEAGRWRLVAEARVGVAAGRDWEVRVRPRLAVPRLFFLLSYALDPHGWKDLQAEFAAAPDLVEAIASGFALHALRAVERGLLRGYVGVEERSRVPRGRIRFSDQIARSASLPLPIEVSYDDYTADVVENRILKSAAAVLLRMPRVPALARRRLLGLRALLDEVSFLARPREVEMPAMTRLNEGYRPALRLAELILRASSLDAEHGTLASSAFVFDMNRVFEDFLSTALREALQPHGGEVRLQLSGSLDRERRLAIRPDVVWFAEGRPRAVIDAKHKALRLEGVPNPDAYQMLAYCTALRLCQGYLVYAKDGGEAAGDITVEHAACEIRVRTLDVELSPELLLDQVAELGAELAADAELATIPA
jgi:5-methylcytosine-specific restriction enzyme subunit McrC